MNFDLTKPCAKCPFRTDCLKGWLGKARATEITTGISDLQQTFACHETVVHDDDGEPINDSEQSHCAGAVILLEKLDRPNQWMRWMERIGFYDRRKMDMTAPVFKTLKAFVRHHTKEKRK